MKKISLLAIALLFLIGCGSNSSSKISATNPIKECGISGETTWLAVKEKGIGNNKTIVKFTMKITEINTTFFKVELAGSERSLSGFTDSISGLGSIHADKDSSLIYMDAIGYEKGVLHLTCKEKDVLYVNTQSWIRNQNTMYPPHDIHFYLSKTAKHEDIKAITQALPNFIKNTSKYNFDIEIEIWINNIARLALYPLKGKETKVQYMLLENTNEVWTIIAGPEEQPINLKNNQKINEIFYIH